MLHFMYLTFRNAYKVTFSSLSHSQVSGNYQIQNLSLVDKLLYGSRNLQFKYFHILIMIDYMHPPRCS